MDRLYAGSLRLYGRGGLAVSPTDMAIFRRIVSRTPGISDLRILEDARDIDLMCALARPDALRAYGALISGVDAAFGRAACLPNITTLKVSILEVQ